MPTINSSPASGPGLLEIGTAGLQEGLRQAEEAARNIVEVGVSDRATADGGSSSGAGQSQDTTVTLSEAAVDLLQAENQFQAAARLVETADELVGTLIDTIA